MPHKGYKQTEEHRRKIGINTSKALKGKPKLKYVPHSWNIGKKGTFVKGHRLSDSSYKKMIETRNEKYTKEQQSEFARKGAIVVLTKGKRKNTLPERICSEILNLYNIGYIQQYVLNNFIYDFWLPQYNLIIEVDGDYWHSLPEMIKRDKIKDEVCYKNNIKILRLKEGELKNNSQLCVTKIFETIKNA